MKTDWLEAVLGRHLGPAKAPEDLWDRVQGHRTSVVSPEPQRSGIAWRFVFATAAVVAVVGAVWTVRARPEPELPSEVVAVRSLQHGPENLTLYSAHPTEVRTWVKKGTGLDIPMPPQTGAAVQLIGARVSSGRVPIAQVSYRVGGQDAVLLVSRDTAQDETRHHTLRSGAYEGSQYVVWAMHGQTYTVASTQASATCLLCHGNGPPPSIN